MRRLSERMPKLRGVEAITLTELRSHVGEVMDMCSMGQTFVLKRGKKIVGVLTQESNVDLTKHVWPDGSIHLIQAPKGAKP